MARAPMLRAGEAGDLKGDLRMLRIVHISDLHALGDRGEDHSAQERVLEALFKDLEELSEDRAIGLIFFSGDLSFDGSPESLARGRELLLDQLRARYPDTPILITPGNHDVDRSLIDPVEEAGLSAILTNRDAVNARLEDPEKAASARARLRAWDEIAADFDQGLEADPVPPYGASYRVEINGLDIAIGVFDSAWRSQGGEQDKGKLLVGSDSVAAFLAAAEDTDLAIVTFHHPLEWLAEFDSKALSNTLERGRSLVLTGHEHVADPSLEITTRGAALYCRAPCSYESPAYSNGYAIVDVDVDVPKTTVRLRRWIPDRATFEADVDTAKDGEQAFPWPIPPDEVPPVVELSDSTALEPLAVIAQEQSVLGDHIDDTTAHTVSDFAVAPRFWPVPHTEVFDRSGDRENRPDEADPIKVLKERNVVTVSGPRMSGVTTALLWLLELHFRREGTHVPVYVRTDARFSLGRIQSAISAAREHGAKTEFPVIITIDDVAPADTRALGRLIRIVKDNPDVLFVFGCHDDEHETISRGLEERLNLKPGRLFLGPFGRRETRALVARIVGAESTELVQKVLSLIQRQRLPRNPLNLAALVSVIVREPTLTAVNESGLLQSYVGVLLDNPLAVDPEGLNMDYRRREHLLQAIALHIVETDITRIPRQDLEQLVLDYFKSIGFQSGSAGQQVDSLIHRRVLAEDESGVGFRYPALLHLFAAKAANDDGAGEFSDLLFANTVKYAPVIRHIAGLKRNDTDTLKKVVSIANQVRVDAAGAVTVDQFDLITDEYGWSKIENLDRARSLVRQRPEPPTEEELDEIYDETIEDPEESLDVRPFEDDPQDGAINALGPAFGLVASVLQSSELIADTDLRKDALSDVIDGWSVMTVLLAVEEDMFKSARELLEPLFSRIEDADKRAAIAEHFARIFIVNMMTIGLYVEAGSIHHEKILGELLDDEEFMSDSANALFSTMLYAMLLFPGWQQRLEALLEKHGSHPMVFETVRLWGTAEYHSGELSKKNADAMESVLVEMLTPEVHGGGPGAVPTRAAHAASVREELRGARVKNKWADSEAEITEELKGDKEADEGGENP
jgi:predicted MPP superfamily phosphohydrolase